MTITRTHSVETMWPGTLVADGRTYATEKACWIVLDRKMEMLPGLSQEPAFQSFTAACIPVDSNS